MKHVKSFLGRESSLLLLFALAWLLFGWPLITVAGGAQGLFLYLSFSAVLIIVLLMRVARALRVRDDGKGEP